MRPVIGWPIAVMLSLLSVIAFANGEAIDEWVKEHAITKKPSEQATLVGITDEESWLVVLIDFPDQNENSDCDQQRASNLIDESARNHINQGLNPNSTLEVRAAVN